MAITELTRDQAINVSLVRMTSTDTLAQVQAAGYLTAQIPNIIEINHGIFEWLPSDAILCYASDGLGLFGVSPDFSTVTSFSGAVGVGTINSGLTNQVAYYAGNGTTISGLPTIPNSTLTSDNLGNLVWGAGGSGGSLNDVYIAVNGSNVTGTGKIQNPYASIEFALSTITTASFTNPFTIHVGSGLFVENTIAYNPNINFVGEGITGTQIVVTNVITLNAVNFDNVASNIFHRNLSLNALAGFSIDYTGVLGLNNTVIGFVNCNVTGIMNFTGRTSAQDQLADLLNVVNSASNVSTAQFVDIGSIILADLTLTECDGSLAGGIILGNLSILGVVNPSNTFIATTLPPGTITINGNFASVEISVQSFRLPTLIGSPSVALTNTAEGIDANFTPNNYTPAGPSVTAHLQAIDAQLLGIPLTVITDTNVQFYPGNGTFTYVKPANAILVDMRVIGAGAAGGGSIGGVGTVSTGGGGGPGGQSQRILAASAVGATETVVVGAAGLGLIGADGGDGGDSSFGVLVTATGGKGGKAGAPSVNYSAGAAGDAGIGTSPVGSINGAGIVGLDGFSIFSATSFLSGGEGGSSLISAGGGRSVIGENDGNPASGNGSGGSGSASLTLGKTGGNGGDGLVVVITYLHT